MSKRDLRTTIMDTFTDMVGNVLYYDRKEDEDLPAEAIEHAIRDGVVTIDELVEKVRAALVLAVESAAPKSTIDDDLVTMDGMDWWWKYDPDRNRDPNWGRVCMRCGRAVPAGCKGAHTNCKWKEKVKVLEQVKRDASAVASAIVKDAAIHMGVEHAQYRTLCSLQFDWTGVSTDWSEVDCQRCWFQKGYDEGADQ